MHARANTIKSGIRYGGGKIRQRWLCKACSHFFFSELNITKPVDTAKSPVEKEAGKMLKRVIDYSKKR